MAGLQPPQRIQRQRTKGWRMPLGAIYVGRPTRWGNPYKVGTNYLRFDGSSFFIRDAEDAVTHYRWWIATQKRSEGLIPLLGGHDLACWCPLDQPCHADVLLEIANA